MIVAHATAGSYLSALNWLTSPASYVSTHYLISKTGHIAQLVDDSRAAWHAGVALWDGETAINEVSLGVELENANDGHDPYPDVQVAAFRALVLAKMTEHHIPLSRILRHLDVAMPRGRKTDPAGLDWPAFIKSLAAYTPGRYRVRGVAVHEGPALTFPVALSGTAFLASGEVVEIDEIKPGGVGHLRDGRGFVLLEQLEKMP